jgi:large subunit ribosomal protein L4
VPQVEVFNSKGEKIGDTSLSQDVFGKEPNKSLVREAVLSHLAAVRTGTVGVKTRSKVRGGGRKPFRQKGLGRARAGTIRSPLWRHGGVVFGPVARDYGWSMPKKAKRQALVSALSAKAGDGKIVVVEDIEMEAPKTKEIFNLLKKLGVEKSSLIVTAEKNYNVWLSSRNIPGVAVTYVEQLNTYDTMSKKHLVLTKAAVKKLEEVLS